MSDIKLHIEVIPHKEQRAGMTGEWWTDENGVVQIRVSRMGDIRYEAMHVAHEVKEWALSVNDPVAMDDKITDAYDDAFLEKRAASLDIPGYGEPGFGAGCPYGLGHHVGTADEMIMCAFYGVNWNDYEKRVCEVAFDGKEFEF
jgi:hypothetical protein